MFSTVSQTTTNSRNSYVSLENRSNRSDNLRRAAEHNALFALAATQIEGPPRFPNSSCHRAAFRRDRASVPRDDIHAMPSCMQWPPGRCAVGGHGQLLVVLGERHNLVECTEQFVVEVEHFRHRFLREGSCEPQGRGGMVVAQEREVGLYR